MINPEAANLEALKKIRLEVTMKKFELTPMQRAIFDKIEPLSNITSFSRRLPWWYDEANKIADHGLTYEVLSEQEKGLIDKYRLSLEQIAWRRQRMEKSQMLLDNLWITEYPEEDIEQWLKDRS